MVDMQSAERRTPHALVILAVWEMSYEEFPATTQQIRDMSNVHKISVLLLFILCFLFVPEYVLKNDVTGQKSSHSAHWWWLWKVCESMFFNTWKAIQMLK